MSDTGFDVVIAAHLVPDLATQNFDAPIALAGNMDLEVEGIALVTVDPDGEVGTGLRAQRRDGLRC